MRSACGSFVGGRRVTFAVAMVVAVFISLLASCGSADASRLSCRDESGQPVDWFVLYKLPATSLKDSSSSNGKDKSDGRAYVYRTSAHTSDIKSNSPSWIASVHPIDSPTSLPGQTLTPLYAFPDKPDLFEHVLLMYNDEFPNGTSSESAAHAKGVVAFDGQSGFWLVHSVPRFPPAPAGSDNSNPAETQANYSFPATGLRYGQTMLCVSLPLSQADLVGEQLRFYHPFVYHWSQPSTTQDWLSSLPNLVAVARGDHVTQPPWYRSTTLVTLAQTAFTSFAKTRQYGLDLYGDWMTSALRSSLYVETWTNGQGHAMPSYCLNRTYTVQNVKQVHLGDGPIFSSHSDHSKWAIANDGKEPWVCVADINRMESQRHRGGGSLCFRQPELWNGFAHAVDQLEACPLSSVAPNKRKLSISRIANNGKMQQTILAPMENND